MREPLIVVVTAREVKNVVSAALLVVSVVIGVVTAVLTAVITTAAATSLFVVGLFVAAALAGAFLLALLVPHCLLRAAGCEGVFKRAHTGARSFEIRLCREAFQRKQKNLTRKSVSPEPMA